MNWPWTVYYKHRIKKIRKLELQPDGTHKRVWTWEWSPRSVVVCQLEEDLPDTNTVWLESVTTQVEMPPEPNCCRNCVYADCGNHGDESPYCNLWGYASRTLTQTSICPNHKRGDK